MKKIFTLVSFIVFVNNYIQAQNTIIDSFIADGVMRRFTLFVPSSYTPSFQSPLVINMHGMNSNMAQQMEISKFSDLAELHNFIVVYPQATVIAALGGVTAWNVDQNPAAANDIQFISNLIDTLSSRYTINPKRVYATGMSHGGYMSYTLACALSQRIAAIASVTGTMNNAMKSNCSATRAVPVMQIHGTTDPIVPYGGNANGIAVDSVVSYWVNHNNTSNTPLYDSIPNTVNTDNSYAHHFVYKNGNNGSTVEFYKIFNGGHTWPGSEFFVPLSFFVGNTNLDFNASTEIWRFFSQFTLDGATSIIDNSAETIVNIYPNPGNDNIIIESLHDKIENIVVIDIMGRVITTTHEQRFSIVHWSNGVYVLRIKMKNGKTVIKKFVKQ